MFENTSNNENDQPYASWHVRYIAREGFECEVTIYNQNISELLENSMTTITILRRMGSIPAFTESQPGQSDTSNKQRRQTNRGQESAKGRNNPAWCPIHNYEMQRWEKNGKIWFSHLVDGKWCTGKTD